MPDQHAAATEHELFTTIAEPLSQLPDDPLSEVVVDFPIALRGYDRIAVDAYVEHTAQLVAELQSTRSPEIAVRRALERVGEEISGILQRAHDTADEITARSRAEADERIEASRREATELTEAAVRQVKDLDAETERIWAERHSIVTDAEGLARRLSELAESALQRFPAADLPREPVKSPNAEVPAPPLFDGALEVPELASSEGQLTAEQAPAADSGLEQAPAADPGADAPITDQPTVGMPPLEPWNGEPLIEPWEPDAAPPDADEA